MFYSFTRKSCFNSNLNQNTGNNNHLALHCNLNVQYLNRQGLKCSVQKSCHQSLCNEVLSIPGNQKKGISTVAKILSC